MMKLSLDRAAGDAEKREVQWWHPGVHRFCHEPAVVCKPGAVEEDDVWVLSVVYDSRTKASELVILDGKDFGAGPVATVRLPGPSPIPKRGTFSTPCRTAWRPKQGPGNERERQREWLTILLRDCVAFSNRHQLPRACGTAQVRPGDLIENECAEAYDMLATSTSGALFGSDQTSRLQVAHCMAALVSDRALWDKWKGQQPVLKDVAEAPPAAAATTS